MRAFPIGLVSLIVPAAALGQQTAPAAPPGPMEMQHAQPSTGAPAEPEAAPSPLPPETEVTTLPNLAEREGWPSPTADDAKYSYVLFDLLEFRENRGPAAIRWDMFGWYGGDVKRVWFKSEGLQSTRRRGGGEQEAQLLYGQLITPFFDFQAGARYVRRSGPGPDRSRAYAVVGLQGFAPYQFELEPSLFLSHKGQVSARVTASYDWLLAQRLVFQPRLEASAALQSDRALEMGSGLTTTELGARLRYEIRREFAPYIGISWSQSYGETKRLAREEGEEASLVSVVAGVRMWF